MPDGVHQLTIESDGMFNWDSTVVAEEYKLLKGAQRSAADEDDDGVRAGSGVEDDEEDSDAYEDDDEDSGSSIFIISRRFLRPSRTPLMVSTFFLKQRTVL